MNSLRRKVLWIAVYSKKWTLYAMLNKKNMHILLDCRIRLFFFFFLFIFFPKSFQTSLFGKSPSQPFPFLKKSRFFLVHVFPTSSQTYPIGKSTSQPFPVM